MFLPIYLAMTGQEIADFGAFSSTLGYMACHICPNGGGLSNMPVMLPENALLCINDSVAIIDPNEIAIVAQLRQLLDRYFLRGILLDFQRPDNPHSHRLIETILKNISCPVIVSHIYASQHNCPVLLPPLPLRTTLSSHLSSWSGREIWLELAPDRAVAIVRPDGCIIEQTDVIPTAGRHFADTSLLCHYCTQIKPDHIAFYIYRTADDLAMMQKQALQLGVCQFVGLWQQLQQFYS